MRVLGISCYYHDSAVAAVDNGAIKFCLAEERVSRVKQDSRFPVLAVAKALEVLQCSINDFDKIAFYEDPRKKLDRLWNQVLHDWPNSKGLFKEVIPYFFHHKLPIVKQIRESLSYKGEIEFCEHHRSHAASTFFTSPFERAAILTLDGVGESETATVYLGEGNRLNKIRSIHFPDSLGLLYSVFTHYLGFEVNEGEYKVMGLAPYGSPKYLNRILGNVIVLNQDGSFVLNQEYFRFSSKEQHYTQKLVSLLGIPPRVRGGQMTEEYMNLAASVQKVLELAISNIVRSIILEFDVKDFCFAGGVALNCTANAHIIREHGIRLHIHPAAGDAGGALGAALNAVIRSDEPGNATKRFKFTPYLGCSFNDATIEATLNINGIKFQKYDSIAKDVAMHLANGNVIGVLQGRDEWGPRALGNRSILADPRAASMKDHLNAKIKFREEFRPFAPVVMEEYYGEWFETLDMESSPYMLFTHKSLKPDSVPSVTHTDGTSRCQTVSREQNKFLYEVLSEFHKLTGVPVLINTSFNLKGEPIVSSPSDALKTFFASGIDLLVIENYMVVK